MACDIHIFTEKLIEARWVCIDPKVLNEHYGLEGQPEYRIKPIYHGRNYELFAMLAGVHNEYQIEPIAYPEGLPPMVSDEVWEGARHWSGDGHSYSHHTLRQLLEYDWLGQSFVRRAVANLPEYAEFRKKGRLKSWSQGIFGPDVQNVSNAEMDTLLAAGAHSPTLYQTPVEWQETYAEAAADFLEIVIPKLRDLAAGDMDSVRIVFWFDN